MKAVRDDSRLVVPMLFKAMGSWIVILIILTIFNFSCWQVESFFIPFQERRQNHHVYDGRLLHRHSSNNGLVSSSNECPSKLYRPVRQPSKSRQFFSASFLSMQPSTTNDERNDKDKDELDFWQDLLERFQGDFDNYKQVVQDRQRGLLPREGGGHEQIHCILVPVEPVLVDNDKTTTTATAARLAAFYFDGIPQRIFRFRYYQLVHDSDNDDGVVDMTLHCLHPALEGQLRAISDPLDWPTALNDFATAADSTTTEEVVTLLEKCDVQWSRDVDPLQHAYAMERNNEKSKLEKDASDLGIHAIMVYGQAIVNSTMMPGTQIKVLDQLSLWHDQFWIHDRGFNPATGDYIYGNQKGVPYQLERVANIVVDKENNKNGDKSVVPPLARQVVREDLQWTLGPAWRTEEEYQAKLDAVGGGVSSQLNARPANKQ